MDLNTVTVAQFKDNFFRDFPYLPEYDPDEIYNTGDNVYYTPTRLFYTALQYGVEGVTPGSDPLVWQVYKDSTDNYILDRDITKAFGEAQTVFNPALYASTEETAGEIPQAVLLPYLYLTAHYLCNDINAARAGISSVGAMPVQSRTVGSVSEAYAIPKAYTDSAALAVYTSSAYGLKYLSMTLPALVGNMTAVYGGTNP